MEGETISTSDRSRFLTGTAATFGSVGILRAPLRAAQFTYKLGASLPKEASASVRLVQMADAIKHETNGRLEIEVYPNSLLGSQSAMLGQLRAGAIQMLLALDVSYSSVVPAVGISSVGFAFDSPKKVYQTLDGPLGDYIVKEFGAKGIYCFDKIWTGGFREVTSYPKPIRTPEDFQGFRIRTPSAAIVIDLFKTLGASPNPLDASEMYTALQTHLVDGHEAQYEYILTFKIYEVTRYLSVTNHMWTGHWLTANMDAWKALPPDIQKIAARNAMKYTMLERHDSDNQAGSFADKLRRLGLKFNDINTAGMRSRLSPYYAKWKNEFGAAPWGMLEQVNGKLA